MGRHAKNLKEENESLAEDFTDVAGEGEVVLPLPSRVMLKKAFILQLRMKGHPSAAVTLCFQEGQIINDPEKIKHLIENNALLEILN